MLCLFVCFGRFSSQSLTCHSYGDVAIAGEGLQMLTYTRHSCLLSSEGSLACHTSCDTMHPVLMVISEDCDTHTYCRAICDGTVTTCFNDLGLSRLGFQHQTFHLRGERSNHCATAAVAWYDYTESFISFLSIECFFCIKLNPLKVYIQTYDRRTERRHAIIKARLTFQLSWAKNSI